MRVLPKNYVWRQCDDHDGHVPHVTVAESEAIVCEGVPHTTDEGWVYT